MTLTDPDGGCDVVGCPNDPEPPDYDLCDEHRGWEDDVDGIILDVEPGDRVEFEYDNSKLGKVGTVEKVDRGFRASLTVGVDGARNPWRVGNSVSTEYQDERRGTQRRHLGHLERIRVVEDEA